MTDALWNRLAALVPEALALPPEARSAFLDTACRHADGTHDDALRAEAEALVAASEAADAAGALVAPAGGRAAGAEETVGPWRLAGRLGEGGMGVVYRAERADGAYARTVALKRLHPSLATALAGRFDAERRTLARLEHEGIARFYDAGVDHFGVPYLIMEFVDGQPLTAFADAQGLGVRARVALFVQVCEAVAYAHQNLIIHRDLKPSNVYGMGTAEAPRVKLLDFGIARLLGDEAAPDLHTGTVLTPSYAAPEQLTRGDATTATDVYALGVLLYELLTGVRPYTLAGLSAAEAERLVCEVPPPRVSTAAPASRARLLRGDLDTIVARALAKEPARRYPTASAFADDLRRFLGGAPVHARPATLGYRAGRFVRRNRVLVGAAAVAVCALVGGAAVALGQARAARMEAARATAVNAFLVSLFRAPNPEVTGRDVRVASLLDTAAARLDTAFARQPDVAATLHHTLGTTYRGLGLYRESGAQFEHALALRTRLNGPGSVELAEVLESFGRMLNERGDYRQADSILTLALATFRQHRAPRSRALSEVLNDLGMVRYETGDYPGAVAAWEEALAIDEATLPPANLDRLVGMANLALALADAGDLAAGTRLLERQLAGLRRYHPTRDGTLANALANLGSFYFDAGRHAEAATLQREAVERMRRAYGVRHPNVAFALNNLGSTLGALGRYAEAEPLLRTSVDLYRAVAEGDAGSPDAGYPLVNLARNLQGQGRLGEAEAAARQAADVFRAGLGPDHPSLARALAVQGTLLTLQGRAAQAVPLLREARAIRTRTAPPDHPERAVAASLLGDALRRTGARAEAESLLVASHAALARAAQSDSTVQTRAREAARRLADLRTLQGRLRDAARLRAE